MRERGLIWKPGARRLKYGGTWVDPKDMPILSRSYFLWADIFRKKSKVSDAVVAALKENILFSTLSERELQYVANMTYERVYEKEEVVFREGKSGFGLYVIVRGQVGIFVQGKDGEVPVTRLEAGSFFGEMALLEEDNIRSASAVATEKAVLIGFFKADLMEILSRQPAMGAKILLQLSRVLSRRLLDTIHRLPDQVNHAALESRQ